MLKTILLAEDDYSLQNIYSMILSGAGFKVVLTSNGKEVLDKLQIIHPDLILLDLMMPELDGLETLEILKKTKLLDKLRIVVLTNIGKSEKTLKLKNYGVLETAVKVDLLPDDLVALVKKYTDD